MKYGVIFTPSLAGLSYMPARHSIDGGAIRIYGMLPIIAYLNSLDILWEYNHGGRGERHSVSSTET